MPKKTAKPEKENKFMMRTVPVRTDLEVVRFLPPMKRCATIFNAHVDWALTNRTDSNNRAHHAVYDQLVLENPDLPIGLIQTVRDTALESVKSTDFERVLRRKPTASLRLDKRLITLRGEYVSVSCIGKRAKTSLAIPEPFKEMVKTWKFVGATLVYQRHERKLWLHLTFKLEKPDLQTEQDTLCIDLGLRHLAVTSDGMWPFGLFKTFLTYKAEALGKRVVVINPRYTSQRCSDCGHIDKGNRHKSRFCCIHCGFRAHADLKFGISTFSLLRLVRRQSRLLSIQPNTTGAG
jgi:hypothetical protein